MLRSPLEDFMTVTLQAVPGVWGKLLYLAELRESDGRYEHWGLARLYGDSSVQQALAEAHRSVLADVLRTPVRELQKDLALSALEREMSAKQYLAELHRNRAALLPAKAGGGSEEHLSSVLEALSSLSRPRKGATLPAA